MLVVGLTGGIGSGKSTVTKLFTQRGVPVIDTDQLARDVTQPSSSALADIVKKFGPDILSPDGSLNRAKLRGLIFTDLDKRLWLEQLLHPLIRAEMQRQIEALKAPYCIVVIPLLFETAPNPLIDRVLVVDASEKQQLQRTMVRDNLLESDIKAVLSAQVSRNKRLTSANEIINNDGKLEDLVPQVEGLHKFYLALALS